MCYLSRSVLVVYGSAFAGSLLVTVFVPSSVTSLGAVDACCIDVFLYVVAAVVTIISLLSNST